MIEDLRCFEKTPHSPHTFVLVLDYPCSGPIECGDNETQHPHQIIKKIYGKCPGVKIYLN